MKEEYIFVFGGFNESFATSVEVFDVSRGIWRDFTIGIQVGNRTKCQVHAISEDSLAIIGGKDEFGVSVDEIGEFNVKHMKSMPTDWRLPIGLSGFGSCSLKMGTIAICGGFDGIQTLNTFTILTFKSNGLSPQVTKMPPMIVAREDFSLLMGPDKKLYAIGGFNQKDGLLDTFEVFDFDKQQWQLCSMKIPKLRGHCGLALPDGIYIIGGFDGNEYQSSMWRFDIAQKRWSQLPSMNTARGYFTSVSSSNCSSLYVIGGALQKENGTTFATNLVERYDMMSYQWETLAPMKSKRYMHGACLSLIDKQR